MVVGYTTGKVDSILLSKSLESNLFTLDFEFQSCGRLGRKQ